MADSASFHTEEHLAGAGLVDGDGGDRDGATRRGEHGGGGMRWDHATATCAAGIPALCQASKPPVTLRTCGNPARSSRLAAMALR